MNANAPTPAWCLLLGGAVVAALALDGTRHAALRRQAAAAALAAAVRGRRPSPPAERGRGADSEGLELEELGLEGPDPAGSGRETGVQTLLGDLDGLSARELRRLPGVGQGRALAIVRARWQHGPAAGTLPLVRVPGIGVRTARRIADWLAER